MLKSVFKATPLCWWAFIFPEQNICRQNKHLVIALTGHACGSDIRCSCGLLQEQTPNSKPTGSSCQRVFLDFIITSSLQMAGGSRVLCDHLEKAKSMAGRPWGLPVGCTLSTVPHSRGSRESHSTPSQSQKQPVCCVRDLKWNRTQLSLKSILNRIQLKIQNKLREGLNFIYIHLYVQQERSPSLENPSPCFTSYPHHTCAPRSPFPGLRRGILVLQCPASQQIPSAQWLTQMYTEYTDTRTSLGPSEIWPSSN